MKTLPIYTVDSFTDKPFAGNPAGVCLLEEMLPEGLMQSIATEINLSETAFVLKKGDGYIIRYFSPLQEIPLCGHATLASAKIIFENPAMTEISFTTNSGVELRCIKEGEQIAMWFPSYDLAKESDVPTSLLYALGIDGYLEAHYNKENNILMLVLEDFETIVQMSPNFNNLVASHSEINGVLVTAQGDQTYDFYSRYFWPWSGNNEDPVTGATHTFMAPYWSKKLRKSKLKSFQASRRTGTMEIEILSEQEIKILGDAVIVMKGQLTVPG